MTVLWLDEPEHHDYAAAGDYLSLLTPRPSAERIADGLKTKQVRTAKAKDILRAAQLGPLPASNEHVAKDAAKIAQGDALSPILLVRGRGEVGVPLTIADGYHRVCASYLHDENTDIRYQIAGWDI